MELAPLTIVKLFLWTPFGKSLSFVMLLCLHLRSFGSGGMVGASLDSELEIRTLLISERVGNVKANRGTNNQVAFS